jgi:hypothetical protein
MYSKIPEKIKYNLLYIMSFFSRESKDKIKRLEKQIKVQEQVFNDNLKELDDERKTYSIKMKEYLNDNINLKTKYENLKIKYNNLVDEYNDLKLNSIKMTPRNRGYIMIHEGHMTRNNSRSRSDNSRSQSDKSRSQSSTKGGKSKKNKLKRNKYSITKRKYI